MHPFLDRILNQLGRKHMFTGEFGKALQYNEQLIELRERIYGKGSFHLIKPTQTIASVYRLQNK